MENTEIYIETQVPQQTTPKHVETQVSIELLTEEQSEVPTEVETEKQAEISTELQTEKQTEASVQTEAVLKETQQSTTKSKQDNNSPKHGDTNDKGQIYVDGFGWIDQGGKNIENIGDSDGDINKQVGIME